MSDSFDFFNGQLNIVKNALPFRFGKGPAPARSSARRRRRRKRSTPTRRSSARSSGRDRSAPVPLVTGIDARLIEAETKLKAGDIAGMMTIMNALRTSPQKLGKLDVAAMAALPVPASQDAAVSLFFGESVLDVRPRTAARRPASPDSAIWAHAGPGVPGRQLLQESGVYGTDVNLPVTDNEVTNPNFHGCIDRNA